MTNHEEYQISNSPWFGDIPSQWKAKRFKYLTQSRKELSKTGEEELLSVTEVRGIVKRQELRSNNESLSRSEDLTGYRHVKKGDLVSNIMLVWKRGLGVSPYNGIVSPAYSVFTFSDECHPEYYNYLVRSDEYITEFRKHSTGITMSRLRLYDDSFGTVLAHVPPIEEQKIISRYLNKKTEQIDRMVEKIQKKIELLKEQRTSTINQYVTKGLDPNAEMKDSGVEGIDQIPFGWNPIKLKYILNYTKGFAFKSDTFTDSGIPIVKASNIKKSSITFPNVFMEKSLSEEFEKVKLKTDDIVISTVGSQFYIKESAVGQLALVPKKLDGSLLNQNTVLFRKKTEDINTEYLFYLLNAGHFRSHLDVHSHGTANQASLNVEDILNYKTCVPPLHEQKIITDYLSINLSKMDKVFNSENSRLGLLKEYRQSLISSVVTGKFRVTEDMI